MVSSIPFTTVIGPEWKSRTDTGMYCNKHSIVKQWTSWGNIFTPLWQLNPNWVKCYCCCTLRYIFDFYKWHKCTRTYTWLFFCFFHTIAVLSTEPEMNLSSLASTAKRNENHYHSQTLKNNSNMQTDFYQSRISNLHYYSKKTLDISTLVHRNVCWLVKGYNKIIS